MKNDQRLPVIAIVGIGCRFPGHLGGHSLLAVRLAGRMSRILGRELRCRNVIENRTVEGIVSATRRPDDASAGPA